MKEYKTEDMKVTWEETPEKIKAVYDKVVDFFKKHESFSGECIMQSDAPIIESPELLSDIADDIMEFNAEYF